MRRALVAWAPFFAWGALLSWLASRPPDALPTLPWGFPGLDKVVHAGFYAPLGLLGQRALGLRGALLAAFAGAALGLGWGSLDEWIQSGVPGRHADWGDLVADACGAAVGALVAWRFRSGRPVARGDGDGSGYH